MSVLAEQSVELKQNEQQLAQRGAGVAEDVGGAGRLQSASVAHSDQPNPQKEVGIVSAYRKPVPSQKPTLSVFFKEHKLFHESKNAALSQVAAEETLLAVPEQTLVGHLDL